MTVIIDYGAGNVKSVEKALQALGESTLVTGDPNMIRNGDHIILPGVGAFGDAMAKLRGSGLDRAVREAVKEGIPFLGICLGLQLLFERSEESRGVEGLGILPGEILRIPEKPGLKIPHIGWNSLNFVGNGRLFQGIEEGAYVYFVHSYYLKAENKDIVTATTNYGTLIHASVEKDHIFGCQFHPEKSSQVGLTILENFIRIR